MFKKCKEPCKKQCVATKNVAHIVENLQQCLENRQQYVELQPFVDNVHYIENLYHLIEAAFILYFETSFLFFVFFHF